MIIESAKNKVIDIPIQLYKTFIIEEKYGFNSRTLKVFFND